MRNGFQTESIQDSPRTEGLRGSRRTEATPGSFKTEDERNSRQSRAGARLRRWRLGLVAVLLCGTLRPGTVSSPATASEEAPGRGRSALAPVHSSCDYCALSERMPVERLGEAGIDSIGRKLSNYNLEVWARTEQRYRSGAFGSPGTDEAKQAARMYFILHSWNGFDYTAQVTDASGRAYSTDEKAVEGPFGKVYCNTTVYPLRFLREAVVGAGGFCMEYNPPERFDERSMLGGVPVRVHTDHVNLSSGPPAPALTVEFVSAIHKTVDLIYEHRFCGRVSQDVIVDRGDTLDLLCLYDIEGMYVRKFGLHKLGALIFWRNHLADDRDPARPRVGACAYFPHISLKLPLFLPDLGLDDLRDFDLPQPVLPIDWFLQKQSAEPDWIRVLSDGTFSPWDGAGPRPRVLDQRFPDL